MLVQNVFENEQIDLNDIKNSLIELTRRNEEQAIQAVSYQRQIKCLFGKINFLENYILDIRGQELLDK